MVTFYPDGWPEAHRPINRRGPGHFTLSGAKLARTETLTTQRRHRHGRRGPAAGGARGPALGAAVRLQQGRIGWIDVVWVACPSSAVRLSADAIVEMEAASGELEPELRAQAAGQLRGRGADWEFERRQGVVAEELIAVAAGIRDARPARTW